MSRAIIGAIVGVALVVIWNWLGSSAVLWSVVLGLIGYGIGWTSEHPQRLIDLLHRLER